MATRDLRDAPTDLRLCEDEDVRVLRFDVVLEPLCVCSVRACTQEDEGMEVSIEISIRFRF